MATKKIITVFGATGQQGGSVVHTFLTDPKLKSHWTVRAVTRDTTKDSAKKLEAQGAEVVAADLNDKSTIIAALKGSHTTFGVTNYWEKLDKALETQQGKNIVDAAKETGIKHLIWSSLLDIKKLTNGALPHVYHFDSKAEVEAYAREQEVPSTFFLAGMYMSNFTSGGLAFRQDEKDGQAWTLAIPAGETAPFPLFDTGDTGKFVKAAVLHREELLGKRILGATEYLTGWQLVESFKKVFPVEGKTAKYVEIPHEVYIAMLTGMGFPEYVAVELWENMRLCEEFGYFGGEGLEESQGFVEDRLTTWEEHLRGAAAFKELK